MSDLCREPLSLPSSSLKEIPPHIHKLILNTSLHLNEVNMQCRIAVHLYSFTLLQLTAQWQVRVTRSERELGWRVTLFLYLTVVFPSIVNVPWLQSTPYHFCFICPILSAVSLSSHLLPAGGPSRHSLFSSPWPGQGGGEPWPAHGRGGHTSCGDVCHWVRGGGVWWRGSFHSVEPSACLTCAVSHCSVRAVFTPETVLTPRTPWLRRWLEAGSASQIRLGCSVGFIARIALVWKVSCGGRSHGCVKAACPLAGNLGPNINAWCNLNGSFPGVWLHLFF